MKRYAFIAFALMLSALTAACNTVEGVGEDVQAGGRSIEHAADSNR